MGREALKWLMFAGVVLITLLLHTVIMDARMEAASPEVVEAECAPAGRVFPESNSKFWRCRDNVSGICFLLTYSPLGVDTFPIPCN